ncbi:MAG: hypothetical protein ABI438_02755 [Dermatophilaceae bacterium]
MDEDPWGMHTPPAVRGEVPALPPRLADLVDLAARGEQRVLEPGESWMFPAAEELPEVQVLAVDGWRPLVDSPMTWLLPAVWPSQHRCWVPDRLPRMSMSFCLPDRQQIVSAWPEGVRADAAADKVASAAECGMPAPPPGRLWLLRSPWPTLGLDVVLGLLPRRSGELGLSMDPCGVLEAGRELLSWSEEQVWSWWGGPQADAAREWRDLGRVGEEAAALVVAGLGPAHTARLTGPVRNGGAGLSERQALAWAEAVGRPDADSKVEAIVGWRSLGLPADPPADEHMVLYDTSPSAARDWLEDGFSFEDVGVWYGVSLKSAREWRDRGFTSEQARALVVADGTLSTEEALAFDEVGVDADARPLWVEAGFTAAQARDWTDVDVLPQEARVWRAMSLGVVDARRHRAAGGGAVPDDVQVGWVEVGWTGHGPGRAARVYGVTDPPGTRGRLASEPHRHPHP